MANLIHATWASAEEFLQKGYLKECLMCLEGLCLSMNFARFPLLEVKTRLRLGQILLKYTTNFDRAKLHLEQANLQLQDLSKDEDDDTYNELQLHIYQCLANVYYQCAQAVMTKKVLKKGYKLSMKMKNINWTEYFRLKLISIYHNLNDDESAIELLKQGEEETKARGDKYLLAIYYLTEAQILLKSFDHHSLADVINKCSNVVKELTPSQPENGKLNLTDNPTLLYIIIHYLIIKALYLTIIGEYKNVHTTLSQLQIYTKEYEKVKDKKLVYDWIKPVPVFVIAVLLSASCFTITGVNKRADHSITSGLTWSKKQISKVTQCNHKLHFDVNNETLLLLALNLFLVERKIIAELTRTDFLNATKDIAFAIHSLITYPHLFNRYRFHIHLIIGIYAVMLGEVDAALSHFRYIIESCKISELTAWATCYTILAKLTRLSSTTNTTLKQQLFDEVDKLSAQDDVQKILGLSAAISFIRGVLCTSNSAHHDALKHLKQSLTESDQNMGAKQLTSQILLILGKVYYDLNDIQQSIKCLSACVACSSKIHDLLVQTHSLMCLSEVYNKQDNQEAKSQYYTKLLERQEKWKQKILQVKQLRDVPAILNWLPSINPQYQKLLSEIAN